MSSISAKTPTKGSDVKGTGSSDTKTPTRDVPLTKSGRKRARMGAEPTPERSGGKKSKLSRPPTRARTLKDMLNTCGKKNKADDETTPKKPKQAKVEKDTPQKTAEGNKENANKCSVTASTLSAIQSTEMVPGPTSRWGHSLCLIDECKAVIIGGQGDKQQMCKDSIWLLDLERRRWSSLDTSGTGQKSEHRLGHTAVYDPTVRCIYLYGGSKHKKWFSDVHMLDIDEWKWLVVKADGKAPTRAYHSANLYRHELWVFGGVYPCPDPQPDGCSNEIHVFSPLQEGWYSPIVMGEKPTPRSGHSATLLKDKLVVFGGWDAPICFNDLFILDMAVVEWSQPKVNGTPPHPRSWHASCALSGDRVLIHGGYDGNDALDDAHIFNLDTLTWTSIQLEPSISARTGHTALCLPYRHDNQEKDEVVVFAGGDNDGTFFQDLKGMLIPFETKKVFGV